MELNTLTNPPHGFNTIRLSHFPLPLSFESSIFNSFFETTEKEKKKEKTCSTKSYFGTPGPSHYKLYRLGCNAFIRPLVLPPSLGPYSVKGPPKLRHSYPKPHPFPRLETTLPIRPDFFKYLCCLFLFGHCCIFDPRLVRCLVKSAEYTFHRIFFCSCVFGVLGLQCSGYPVRFVPF